MGSISRPPHRNHVSAAALSRKLSNANGFSGQNPYDGVFGGVRKLVAPTFSSTEDYKEIFGSSQGSRASSIPVLDLSALDEANVSPHFRSSKLDYSKIFDGFRDEEIGVSYEELCALRGGKSSSDEARTPSASGSPLLRPDHLNCSEQNQVFSSEASDQSSDAVKQFNMSYHKTSPKGKDGTNGTTHVAELRAVPGFTCFIDGIPLQKKENDKPILTKKGNDKPKPSAISDVRHKMDSGDGVLEGKNSRKTMKKQTSGGAVKSRSESSCDGTYSNKLFNANEINLKSHPSKAPPPSSLPGEMGNSKGHLKRATVSNFEATKCDAGDSSPLFFDEELDENSAAAVSAAALKKAIEKAQESIRIAKELMERKKEGFQSCSNWSSKYSLKVKDKKEDIIAHEGNVTKEKNAKERRERADAVYQNFTGMVRENALKSGEVAPDLKESEKLIIGRKVIGEIHVKSLESAENYETATQFSELLNTGADKHEGEFKEMKTTKETLDRQEGIAEKSEAVNKVNELEYMERKQNAVKMAQDWEENEDKLGAYIVHEHDENEKSGIVQEDEETEEKQKVSYEQVRCEKILEESQEAIEDENKFESQDLKENDNEEKISGALELVENESKEQEVPEQEHIEKRIKDAEKEENEKRQKKIQDEEVIGKKLEEVFQWAENENKLEEACCGESNEKKQKDAHEGEISEKRMDEVHGLEKNEKTPTDAHDGEESVNQIKEEYELEENEKSDTVAYIYEGENIQRENDESEENEKIDDEKRSTDAYDGKDIDKKKEECEWEGNEKRVTGPYIYEEPEYIQRETDESEENEKIEVPEEALYENNFNRVSDACSHDASNSISETDEASISETEETCQHEINDSDVETSPSGSYNNGSTVGVTNVFWEIEVDEAEGVEVAYKLKEKEMFKIAGLVQAAAEYNETGKKVKDASEALPSDGNAAKFGVTEMDIGQKLVEQNNKDSELASNIENGIEILVNESRENEQIIKDDELAFDEEEEKINPETVHRETQWAENAAELEVSQVRSVSKEREKSIEVDEEIKTSQDTEKNQDNLNKTSAMEEMDTKETVSKEVEEKEHLRKIDEANKREREREREREKDRLAVERAIREVRERAFVEARERAERAAVERAKAEVRQRVMAGAREKLEKASEGSKSSAGKASIEAKLRAERAAVERATAEARERALEKALSQKTTSDARPQAERFVAEKFSGTSRDDAMNQSFYSSDSQKFDGMNTESGQRYKARSESHQRIMQRAAKALAEKNMRDVLAQREQAERDRLAETLDADVKRWSSGKEGNLRALLSTLQYILGHGSGWQPVSLTEIITTNAVKKAYRKATLCVHPDKLQQRGASIQQKYICEKVFDLLKAAWNKFNSEER